MCINPPLPLRTATSTEEGVLRSRYPSTLIALGYIGTAEMDHRRAVDWGVKGSDPGGTVLLHGEDIDRRALPIGTPCPLCADPADLLDQAARGITERESRRAAVLAQEEIETHGHPEL